MFRLEIFIIGQVTCRAKRRNTLGSQFFYLKFLIIEIDNKNIKLLEITSKIKFKTTNIKIHCSHINSFGYLILHVRSCLHSKIPTHYTSFNQYDTVCVPYIPLILRYAYIWKEYNSCSRVLYFPGRM
jgi:hypothetical protein